MAVFASRVQALAFALHDGGAAAAACGIVAGGEQLQGRGMRECVDNEYPGADRAERCQR